MNNNPYVYIVTDEDNEILGVSTDLIFAKKIISSEFNDDYYDMTVRKTNFGYRIDVKDDGIRYTYYADRKRLRGVI